TGSVALNGVVSGDVVSTGGITFTFADKNAGTGKAVAVGGALSGADAGNYTVNLPASVLADILKKALSATITINGKTYDGTTAATGSVALNGVVAGDTVGTSGTAFAFTDKNAGTGKTVSVSGTTLTGTDSGNYTLTIPASVLADIAKRGLSLSADDKEKYSRDPDPALTYTITLGSLVAGDQLSGALTRADGETPGKYAINQGSLSAGDNYTLTFTPGTLTISVDPATNQPQALRTLPLPSGIQAPPTAGSTVNVDAEALCADDSSCVAN
ncbi:MAG: YDG domain-containing protein, partial [Tsuneonella sp.]